jgi:hypothetical protein
MPMRCPASVRTSTVPFELVLRPAMRDLRAHRDGSCARARWSRRARARRSTGRGCRARW